MKTLKFLSLLILVLIIIPFFSIAQIGPPPIDPGCNPDLGCPIDDNVIFLIAAVVVIAVVKSFKKIKTVLA